MILFFISLILVCLTALFTASILEKKEFIKFLIYFLTIMFADVVLIFEILSLLNSISVAGFILLDTVLFTGAFFAWKKYKFPMPKFLIKDFGYKFINTLKRDKYLMVLGACFIFMCCVSLFLISFMPIVNPDAESYHVVRSLFWIVNGNLNHFDTSEVRMLPMPINSELLYAWILMFTKKQIWFGIFPFSAFVMVLTSLYGIFSYIKVSERKKLWTLFILSSFPSVIVQISGTETDIIIAGLILSSIYLYWNSLKTKTIVPLFMSALCYALAIGTKTPSIILIPAVGLWMTGISYYYDNKKFYKPLLKFIGFGVINFIVFASYNYVLNVIDYGNIAGPVPFLISHQNLYGVKGGIANIIKHMFLFFDFTGFTWSLYAGKVLVALKTSILTSIDLNYIPDGVYSKSADYVNKTLLEPLMGMSILGFLVYLPCWVKSLFGPLFHRKKRDLLIFSFGVMLLVAIVSMSFNIMYMSYNIRFLTCFCVITAPVLLYSYPRKNHLVKFVITFFAVFGLVFVSTNLWARPAAKIFSYFRAGKTVSEVREVAKCSLFFRKLPKNPTKLNEYCKLESKIRNLGEQNKILYFSNSSEEIFLIKLLDLQGYNVDFGTIENIKNIDLSKYNAIITLANTQFSTNVRTLGTSYSTPDNGVNCVYINLVNELYVPKKDIAPYMVKCQFAPHYLEDNGFRLHSILETTLKQNKNSMKVKYRFYENVNNPIMYN